MISHLTQISEWRLPFMIELSLIRRNRPGIWMLPILSPECRSKKHLQTSNGCANLPKGVSGYKSLPHDLGSSCDCNCASWVEYWQSASVKLTFQIISKRDNNHTVGGECGRRQGYLRWAGLSTTWVICASLKVIQIFARQPADTLQESGHPSQPKLSPPPSGAHIWILHSTA